MRGFWWRVCDSSVGFLFSFGIVWDLFLSWVLVLFVTIKTGSCLHFGFKMLDALVFKFLLWWGFKFLGLWFLFPESEI